MSDSNESSDVVEELKFIEGQARQNIWAWKAHLLRCVNPDEARLDVIESLNECSVLVVQDWVMTFLPRKLRESQSGWSWHITVATRRAENQELQMITFVHVYQTCNQDSCAVLSIMKGVIKKLTSQLPQLKTVFYRQDNACCYHCEATIVGASFARCCSGVSVKRMDFSDPQGGEGPCDRKAASIKTHMRVYLNQGSNIDTAKEMEDAIQSLGGVPEVDVTLCSSSQIPKPSLNEKIEGVSLISNIEYNDGSLRVWKAYGIGPGKCVQLTKLGVPSVVPIPDLAKYGGDTVKPTPNAHFIKIKSSLPPRSDDSQECSDTEEDPRTDTPPVPLFSRPEEGCVKEYQRFSSLPHHLDLRKHERALEHATLLDSAVLGYADRLQEQSSGMPQLQQVRKRLSLSNLPCLPMGWALKSSHVKRTRCTEKQRDYLSSKFRIGQTTGQKVDAASVAKSMMTGRDSNGQRLFIRAEFLTSQ